VLNFLVENKKSALTRKTEESNLSLGRCGKREIEHRQMATDGVKSFVRRLGSWSRSNETNRWSVSPKEKFGDW